MPLFLAGLHLSSFCYVNSDGLRSMCVVANHKSSKVRTYTKTSVYILLKNDATDRCRWCATSRGVTRLDKSIITEL